MQADPLSTLDAGRGMIETTSSQFRENLLEHVFIAELLQECALVRRQKAAVLRAEVDEDGYDLVLELDSVLRHVQLKSRYGGDKPSRKALDGLNPKLGGRIGGCVVLMYWRAKDGRIELTAVLSAHDAAMPSQTLASAFTWLAFGAPEIGVEG